MIVAVVLIVFLLAVRLAVLWVAALFQLGVFAKEFADVGHYDGMMMTPSLRAKVLYLREQDRRDAA